MERNSTCPQASQKQLAWVPQSDRLLEHDPRRWNHRSGESCDQTKTWSRFREPLRTETALRSPTMRTKLGLFNLMGLRDQNTSPLSVVRTTVDMVEMAEDFGFDVAWFAEHHFTNHSICPSALLMIANCAPRTQHIRLGSAVVALPFH